MSDEQRPPIWVGHVSIRTRVLDETEAFFKSVTEPGGNRIVVNSTHVDGHSQV